MIVDSRTLLWIAISIAAFINMIVSGYAGFMHLLEIEGIWTMRLYLLTIEHYWWVFATIGLIIAFICDIIAFVYGESVDTSILILATEIGFGVFMYVIESVRQRKYRYILWLAWTNSSRSERHINQLHLLKEFDLHNRKEIIYFIKKTKQIKPRHGSESIFNPIFKNGYQKIDVDLEEALNRLQKKFGIINKEESDKYKIQKSEWRYPIIKDQKEESISVLWGGPKCPMFRVRASRGTTMFPLIKMRNSFSLIDITLDKWIVVASGILSRNKGLMPGKLVCKLWNNTSCYSQFESSSTWFPRPNKTARSIYRKDFDELYSTLGIDYVTAATELALIMADVDIKHMQKWLEKNCEHQDINLAWELWEIDPDEELQQELYITSYASMLLSLNCNKKECFKRADIICLII